MGWLVACWLTGLVGFLVGATWAALNDKEVDR
jgi:hypothetical protein